jgi:23S rRNA (cytidine1920-2'-O)/16S rRNA (cytidine1409-2'-O)-methyltransferase
MKQRLDKRLVELGLVPTRSQAESYIRLGEVKVSGKVITKPGELIGETDVVNFTATEQYVSRAALKLASVAQALRVDFRGKTVLDIGSSTGGFTDYALKHGAAKSIAVEVGTNQLHPSLHGDPRIELHEQTDVRNLRLRSKELRAKGEEQGLVYIEQSPDIAVMDVSFISAREVLPAISKLLAPSSQLIAMIKPQFEAVAANLKHKGVIKNDRMRRDILKDFESWATQYFVIVDKADSEISGSKGNVERFYLLKVAKTTPVKAKH